MTGRHTSIFPLVLILGLQLSACGGDGPSDVVVERPATSTDPSELPPSGTPPSEPRPTEPRPPESPLIADFSFEISYVDLGQGTFCPVDRIEFTDLSTGDPDGWLWEGPDGFHSTEQHPWVPIGLWGTVTLTVTRGGVSDQTSQEIHPHVC
jgi:PKD repeat protein